MQTLKNGWRVREGRGQNVPAKERFATRSKGVITNKCAKQIYLPTMSRDDGPQSSLSCSIQDNLFVRSCPDVFISIYRKGKCRGSPIHINLYLCK